MTNAAEPAPAGHYDETDRARRYEEPAKRAGADRGEAERSEFQRDRARVLHSYAFRRLADKTQVVVPGSDDFPRTRLTHSLEVAQIGREMGAALGCDPDIVDTAGLAHDLGHPPFGHNGEHALAAAAEAIGGFEGNAQTFRILTRLEAKVMDPAGRPAGLNLTRASIDAVCKYPWPRRVGTVKFGVYADDREAFDWARAGASGAQRCIEAQVMDWADDVAYSVHDIDDGVHAGYIRLESIDDSEREALCEIAAELYSPRSAAELAPVLEALLDLPTLKDLSAFDGSYLAQAAAKRTTSELTGRFVAAAVRATRDTYGREDLQRYTADLIVPEQTAAECALLKAFAVRYVMQRRGVADRQAAQRVLLTELVAALTENAPHMLDVSLRPAWQEAPDDAGRLRVVIDQVAQLTDSSAHGWHARLVRRAG